jgi:hypothetical protein
MVEVYCGDHMQTIRQVKLIDWIKIDVVGHDLLSFLVCAK